MVTVRNDKLMKLSGAVSFYMIFSMGPLLLIIITMCSYFFGRDAVEGKVYSQLEGFIGHDTALQLQSIIQHAAVTGYGYGSYSYYAYGGGKQLTLKISLNLSYAESPREQRNFSKSGGG